MHLISWDSTVFREANAPLPPPTLLHTHTPCHRSGSNVNVWIAEHTVNGDLGPSFHVWHCNRQTEAALDISTISDSERPTVVFHLSCFVCPK